MRCQSDLDRVYVRLIGHRPELHTTHCQLFDYIRDRCCYVGAGGEIPASIGSMTLLQRLCDNLLHIASIRRDSCFVLTITFAIFSGLLQHNGSVFSFC